MQNNETIPTSGVENIELAKKCLALISTIAVRGACSQDPNQVGYALQELTQVLLERTGNDERLFEPVPADQIPNLEQLHSELDFVETCATDMATLAPSWFKALPVQLS